jgi:hypothetical protein
MSETLNIYCDESCHLLNDGQEVMTLGALWCPLERRREISVRLREIKAKHGIPVATEIKWVKVSPAKAGFCQDVHEYDYVVILWERRDYYLLKTAFYPLKTHKRNELERDWRAHEAQNG